MSEDELVTFRTGEDEIYFEALNDMADDGYFGGNFSQGIRDSLSGYMHDKDFPSQDFSLYVKARAIADETPERERVLDDLFFYRAVDEFFEDQDFEALEELDQLERSR